MIDYSIPGKGPESVYYKIYHRFFDETGYGCIPKVMSTLDDAHRYAAQQTEGAIEIVEIRETPLY